MTDEIGTRSRISSRKAFSKRMGGEDSFEQAYKHGRAAGRQLWRRVPGIHREAAPMQIVGFGAILPPMNDLSLKIILESAEAWPEEDRRELADYARVIEAR